MSALRKLEQIDYRLDRSPASHFIRVVVSLASIVIVGLFLTAYTRGYRFERVTDSNQYSVSSQQATITFNGVKDKKPYTMVAFEAFDDRIERIVSQHPYFPRYGLFAQPNSRMVVAAVTDHGKQVVFTIGEDGYRILDPTLYFRKRETGWR